MSSKGRLISRWHLRGKPKCKWEIAEPPHSFSEGCFESTVCHPGYYGHGVAFASNQRQAKVCLRTPGHIKKKRCIWTTDEDTFLMYMNYRWRFIRFAHKASASLRLWFFELTERNNEIHESNKRNKAERSEALWRAGAKRRRGINSPNIGQKLVVSANIGVWATCCC